MKQFSISPETTFINSSVAPSMTVSSVNDFVEKYQHSSRRRHRYCFHQDPEVELHDIVICYDSGSYIPPNKHIGKAESLHVLQGELDFFLFNDNGQVYDYRRLSASDNKKIPFYLRVPPNTWHGLRAVGDQPCIIKETISGPYDASSLMWAPFAPNEAEGSDVGHKWYENIFEICSVNNISPAVDEVFTPVTDTVYRSNRQLVTVCIEQLQPIIKAAIRSPLKRARLCCHDGPEEKLQEMFIALARGVDIEESVHLRKDESLTVIDGNGKYIFPNEDGSTRKVIELGPFKQNSEEDHHFFSRINRYVPHKIHVESEVLLIHEATTGPFYKSDTDYRIKRTIK